MCSLAPCTARMPDCHAARRPCQLKQHSAAVRGIAEMFRRPTAFLREILVPKLCLGTHDAKLRFASGPSPETEFRHQRSQTEFGNESGDPLLRRHTMIKLLKIHSYEVGLYFRNGEFRGLLDAGSYVLLDVPFCRARVDVVSQRAPWLVHEKLDVIVKSGALNGRAKVLDLKDYERALVWIDGRFSHVLPPGLSAYWTTFCDVKAEIVDARDV